MLPGTELGKVGLIWVTIGTKCNELGLDWMILDTKHIKIYITLGTMITCWFVFALGVTGCKTR